MTVGHFRTWSAGPLKDGESHAMSVTAGRRFDRIEIICTASDLDAQAFREWMRTLQTRLVNPSAAIYIQVGVG
jgi:hypothetical protein